MHHRDGARETSRHRGGASQRKVCTCTSRLDPVLTLCREYYSVTSLSFISADRNHLLATAADGYTSVRLWDIRSRCSRRPSRYYTPLTSTRLPGLQRKRDYGITSLTVSGDASRLYALCRDSTLYAYSTQHLVLGHAPALDLGAAATSTKSRFGHDGEGLGPIYGLRHAGLQVQSFYVKAALRPARGDRPELVALGSSDSCAVLMPTDERDFVGRRQQQAAGGEIPIYQVGAALTNGHRREVTGLAWSHDGDLVTLSDDFSARCWREDAALARCIRQKRLDGYEQRCGRAEVEEGFDEDDV
jgi:WD40 repeat protein